MRRVERAPHPPPSAQLSPLRPASPSPMRKRTAAQPPVSPQLLRPRPRPKPQRFRSLEEVMKEALPARQPSPINGYAEVKCTECGSGEREDELLLCDRCDRGCHLNCLRPIIAKVPVGPWLCSCCSGIKQPRRFPLVQKKIADFFRIQKDVKAAADGFKCSQLLDGRRRNKRHSLVIYKKRRLLLPFTPSLDAAKQLEQMASLATALTACNMEFSNELTYLPGMATRLANQACLECGGMQVLSRTDKETVALCKTMQKGGQYPPLRVVFDSLEGFTVQADELIKDMTFISEYVGDVDYLKKRENDDCDCMMTLLLAEAAANCLVVCPDKRGNIARFINGINNHTPDGKKKQNIKCARYNVDGECRVFLVACRDISPGERLYYDYNGCMSAQPPSPSPTNAVANFTAQPLDACSSSFLTDCHPLIITNSCCRRLCLHGHPAIAHCLPLGL